VRGVFGVHETVPVVIGVGVHVHPGIVRVDPVSAENTIGGVVLDTVYGAVVSHQTDDTIGARGAMVSTMNVLTTGADTLPAVSIRVTEYVLDPPGSGVVGVKLYVPSGATVPVPMRLPAPSRSVKIEPGSPVPFSVGVVSLVTEPEIGHVIVSGVGAVVSTVNVVFVGIDALPTASVRVTE
jgi:hypothetical protein